MLELLEFYEKFDYLFALAFSVLVWLIGYFSKHFVNQLKRAKIGKALRLNKGPVSILIPDRHGKLTLSSEGSTTELTDCFVTKGEMEAACELKDEMRNFGLVATISNRPTKEKNANIFCIGGPLSNANTARYFRNKSVFQSITIGVHKDSQYLSERNRKGLADLVHEDTYYEDGQLQGSINLNGKTVFTFNRGREGYIFLARLTSKADFHNGKNEVVHICFGNNSVTTLSAIKCYFDEYDELSKLTKHKGHYCLIIRCDKEGNLNFNDIHDFTNEFLKQNVKVSSKP